MSCICPPGELDVRCRTHGAMAPRRRKSRSTRVPAGPPTPEDPNARRWSDLVEESDESAVFALQREMIDPEIVARFTVDGEPESKARPRLGRGDNVYTPRETKMAEQRIGWQFRKVAPKGYSLNPSDRFGVFLIFHNGSQQRRDVDNMIKLVLDGLNDVAWPDDSQVTEVSARKVRAVGGARTDVVIYRTWGVHLPDPSLDRLRET